MTKITFKSEIALSAFHSMCEGMWEVARDDDESARVAAFDKLIEATAVQDNASFPVAMVLPSDVVEMAHDVVANLDSDEDYNVDDVAIESTEQSIFDYFRAKLGVYPNDETFRELPVDSNCGDDCRRAIDAAAILLKADSNAGGDYQDTIRQIVFEACQVYWHG